ncbi:MAG: 2-thiouracil desulfurase family protein [Candidatus Aquicultor sp.]
MDKQADDPRTIKWVVSSCLIGLKTRYDGRDKFCSKIQELVEKAEAVPFCPEQGGGLATPRPPAEIIGGDGRDVLAGRARVINKLGKDVTEQFIRGASQMLELARITGATGAIITSLSPSCGVGAIYDGTFSGTIREGDGVAAALLRESGLEVITEKEFEDEC